MNIRTEKDLPIKLPLFYQEVIFSWNLCGGGSKAPQSQTEIRKVQVGKDQEKAQSEKDSHSKNRGGKKPN